MLLVFGVDVVKFCELFLDFLLIHVVLLFVAEEVQLVVLVQHALALELLIQQVVSSGLVVVLVVQDGFLYLVLVEVVLIYRLSSLCGGGGTSHDF